MREIVLDTETTGMDPKEGHRIIEIGCVELVNHLPTGKTCHLYINPEREVPQDAIAVHGITNEFLEDKPVFSQVYSEFIDFVGDATMVIHNAEFDMKFINWELSEVGHNAYPWSQVLDTLAMARKKFPGSPANLDALCRRFGIDNSERVYHGALLDSELLSEVYLELLGGRQHGLILAQEEQKNADTELNSQRQKQYRAPREFSASVEELAAHKELCNELENPLWDSIETV